MVLVNSKPQINADACRFKKIPEPDNRDFLRELHLTEGRNTGFRKIRRALLNNGSPEPVFKRDDERSYFLTVLRIHSEAQVKITDTQVRILSECTIDPKSKREIAQMPGHSEVSGSVKKAIAELISSDLLDYTIPEKPRSRLWKYRTTGDGI